MGMMDEMMAQLEEWDELLHLGLIVQYDNGLQGMANGPEWCRIPLCNDGEDQ